MQMQIVISIGTAFIIMEYFYPLPSPPLRLNTPPTNFTGWKTNPESLQNRTPVLLLLNEAPLSDTKWSAFASEAATVSHLPPLQMQKKNGLILALFCLCQILALLMCILLFL
jgi:hypothetical protein